MKIRGQVFLICSALFLFVLQPDFLSARDHSIVRFGKDVIVEKHERVESAVSIGGDVKVYGTVDESAVAVGGSVFLGPHAVVREDVVSVGGEINDSPGAMIDGDLVEVDDFLWDWEYFPFGPWQWHWRFWPFRIIPFIGILALALVLAALVPQAMKEIARIAEVAVLKSLLYGLMILVLFIPAMILLAISVFGIPLIPVLVFCVVLAAFLGYITVAQIIGQRLLVAFNKLNTTALANTFLGVTLLWIIGFIPIIGGLIKVLVFVVGLGAIWAYLLEKWQIHKENRGQSVPPPNDLQESSTSESQP